MTKTISKFTIFVNKIKIRFRAELRKKRKEEKVQNRKSPTKKLRLPGKLADCSKAAAEDTEIFIVDT